MVNVTICTVLLLHVLVVTSLQIKRQGNGDEVINGEKCADQRTYVFGGSQTKPGRCVRNIKEAGCDWELNSKSLTFGFVTKSKSTTFDIRLLEKTYFPNGQLCRNHSDGKIEVQNTNAYLNTSIWDSNIGEHIKRTLTYQFDYGNKFMTVGFAKHWEGMLIKLFINCLNEKGENILEAAQTRCVMIKYEGTATYPLKGDKYFPPSTTSTTSTQTTSITTTTRTQTSSTTTNDFTTTTKVTDQLTESTFPPASTTASVKTQPVYQCSNETNNVLIALLSGFGGCLICSCLVILIGKKRNFLIISICWKNKEREVKKHETRDNVIPPSAVGLHMHEKSHQVNDHYTELSLPQNDIFHANYASLHKDNAGYDTYEAAPTYE